MRLSYNVKNCADLPGCITFSSICIILYIILSEINIMSSYVRLQNQNAVPDLTLESFWINL